MDPIFYSWNAVQALRYLKYREAPMLLFIPAQVSAEQNRPTDLRAALPTISAFPDSIVSPRAHLLPSATVSCYYMRSRLSFWTAVLTWVRRACSRASQRTIGFQFSGPRGGFPFKNVSPVNMSPGWKVIPWKTGRMFSKTCCWSLSPQCQTPTTHTQLKVRLVDPLPSRGIVCLQRAALEWFSLNSLLQLSIIRFTQRFTECGVSTHRRRTCISQNYPIPSGVTHKKKAKRLWPLSDKFCLTGRADVSRWYWLRESCFPSVPKQWTCNSFSQWSRINSPPAASHGAHTWKYFVWEQRAQNFSMRINSTYNCLELLLKERVKYRST